MPATGSPQRRTAQSLTVPWRQGSTPSCRRRLPFRAAAAVDFDDDGFVDLIFVSRLMINDRRPSATASLRRHAGSRGQRPQAFDVDLEAISTSSPHGLRDATHRNDGGAFDAGEVIDPETVDTFGFGITACDINIDGFEDVIVARNLSATGAGAPKILVNVNGTLLRSATQLGTTADPDLLVVRNDELACGDTDADGNGDILARWGLPTDPAWCQFADEKIRLRIVGGGDERKQKGGSACRAEAGADPHHDPRIDPAGSAFAGMYDPYWAPWAALQ